MHVLILPSWYPRNAQDIGGSFFREQAIALEKAGCKVGVLSVALRSLRSPANAVLGGFSTQQENDCGVATYRKHGVNWFPRLLTVQQFFYERRMMALFKLYIKKHGKPNIIHVHSMLNAGLAAKKIKNRYGIPYVITEHSSAYARGLVSSRGKELASLIANQASARFSVSTPFSELLSGTFNQNNNEWGVIPNIVNDLFSVNCDSVESNKRNEEFVFLNVCLLSFNKRVDLLLDAFSQVFKGKPNIKLRIGGDGEERSALEAQTKRLGIEKQVAFLGMLSRDQVAEEMANMNAFVLGSEYETFGVVVIEALAKGKPVIATRCGGPEDIIREQDGLLVPTNDANAMATAMQQLYQSADQYDPVEIRNSCQLRYGESAIANRLISHYRKVVGTRASKEVEVETECTSP